MCFNCFGGGTYRDGKVGGEVRDGFFHTQLDVGQAGGVNVGDGGNESLIFLDWQAGQ